MNPNTQTKQSYSKLLTARFLTSSKKQTKKHPWPSTSSYLNDKTTHGAGQAHKKRLGGDIVSLRSKKVFYILKVKNSVNKTGTNKTYIQKMFHFHIFSSIQFNLYSAKSKQQLSRGALYYKAKTPQSNNRL